MILLDLFESPRINKMKSIIRFVAKNKFFHLFLGLVTAGAGIHEVGATIIEDISSGNIHGGHGVVAMGIWHLCKALGDIIEGSDYLEEGIK